MSRKCCGQAEPGKTWTLIKPDGSKVVYSTRTEALAALSVAPGSAIIGPS